MPINSYTIFINERGCDESGLNDLVDVSWTGWLPDLRNLHLVVVVAPKIPYTSWYRSHIHIHTKHTHTRTHSYHYHAPDGHRLHILAFGNGRPPCAGRAKVKHGRRCRCRRRRCRSVNSQVRNINVTAVLGAGAPGKICVINELWRQTAAHTHWPTYIC